MSFLGSQKENTQAQENDCPYRPTHSQSWRVCFCYRLPFFTVLCSAPDTVRSPPPHPPRARGVSLPSSHSWCSHLLPRGFQVPVWLKQDVNTWRIFLDKIIVQEPQWTWPLSPIRRGGAVHHLENLSMVPTQEKSLCVQCLSQDHPVHLLCHLAVLIHREMSQHPENKFFWFYERYIFRRESYF